MSSATANRTYQEYHYHSLAKLVFMNVISFGTYGLYYWYRLWRGKYNQENLTDRSKSFGSMMFFYFLIHSFLNEISERLKKTDPKLALTHYKSPTALTTVILLGTFLLMIVPLVLFLMGPLAATGPMSFRVSKGVIWLASMLMVLWPVYEIQSNINSAYLQEHKQKPKMPTRGYFWHGVFLLFALLQLGIMIAPPTESDLQNVDIDYSGKLPKELLSM